MVGHFNRFRFESGVKKQPTTQLEVKTLLNRIQHFIGFIYHSIRLRGTGGTLRVEVKIRAHRGIRGKCATCQQPCPGYDQLEERRWLFVPLWGITAHFFYQPRRVECPEHGVGVEKREYLPEMFGPDEMDAMRRIRGAFDPLGIANPGKMLAMGDAPSLRHAGLHPLERSGLISRE